MYRRAFARFRARGKDRLLSDRTWIEAIARDVTMGNKLGDKGRRHEPNFSMAEIEARAFRVLSRSSSVTTVRRLLIQRHGKRSEVVHRFDELRRNTPRLSKHCDPVPTEEQVQQVWNLR